MGARLAAVERESQRQQFQSTRPAWGRDSSLVVVTMSTTHFNPHAPHGGATQLKAEAEAQEAISIHTPRMGARRQRTDYRPRSGNFNPHAPHGGATSDLSRRMTAELFQSTRPAWGRDGSFHSHPSSSRHFNPHAPHGGATVLHGIVIANIAISIHTPRMGARPEQTGR